MRPISTATGCRTSVTRARPGAARTRRTAPTPSSRRWLGEDGLRYVKLDATMTVTRVVLAQGGILEDKKPVCPQPPCNIIPQAVSTTSASAPRPPTRQGHASVLSASRGALWVFGGRAESGAELRDLWRWDVASERWRALPMPSGVVLGRVLAATYSPVDDRLWVFDEVAPSRARDLGEIRLLALHPDGGAGEVATRWPHRSRNEEFGMSVDPEGALWIAGWPTAGRVHAVLRLVRSGGAWVVDGWDLGVGRIHPDGVRAGDRGLSVVAEIDPRRGPELRFHETAGLRRGPGGEHACF